MNPVAPADWLQHFVLPLVAGGDVRVAGPLDVAALELYDRSALDGEPVGERLAEARQAVMAEVLWAAPKPALDRESLRLAIAVQNLLFLAHPSAERAWVRRKKREELARFSESCARLAEPAGAAELAARHSILHHLFELEREDVRITFWAGQREFRGAQPPPRLLKWPEVRRVHEERWRVGLLAEAMADPLERPIAQALLEASPLTDLFHPVRGGAALDLGAAARWLRDPQIARAVADCYLSSGLAEVGASLAAALLGLCSRLEKERLQARPRDPLAVTDARTATAFVCHLQLLELISRRRLAGLEGELRALVQAQGGLKDLYALFAAAQRLGIGRPSDLGKDPGLIERVNAYAAACRTVAGDERVAELEGLLARTVGPHVVVA